MKKCEGGLLVLHATPQSQVKLVLWGVHGDLGYKLFV